MTNRNRIKEVVMDVYTERSDSHNLNTPHHLHPEEFGLSVEDVSYRAGVANSTARRYLYELVESGDLDEVERDNTRVFFFHI